MKSLSLQAKLVALVTISLALPLVAALVSLGSVYGAAQRMDAISREDFDAQDAVSLATIHFKQQVQEWKDVLLRGHDDASLQKHWASFEKREGEVVASVQEARGKIAYDDLRAKLDEFLAAHGVAGQRYREGLRVFKANNFDPRAGDSAVTGIDRIPTDLLLEAEGIARQRGNAAVAKAVARASNAYRWAIATIVAAIVIALVGCWFFVRFNVIVPIREAMRFAWRIAEGDLTGRISSRSGDEVGQLLQALGRMNESLGTIVEQMRAAAESVAVASGQVASGATALSQQTEEQASSLEETAASMEELASTVQQNAENARKADSLARSASATAQAGGEEVGNVVATMNEISGASRQIVEIVSVIDSIAFQTNILALNAAVEAARAGEQGRGFAVVAAEVRSLAQRCASAAKEIKSLIERSSQKVDAGVDLVERAGATIEKLVGDVGKVTDLMGSIAEASGEQARGVQQINRTVTEMDKVVQQNAAAVQESASAAEGMRRQADSMVNAVNAFRVGDVETPRAPAAAPKPFPALARTTALPRAVKSGPTTEALALAGGGDWREF